MHATRNESERNAWLAHTERDLLVASDLLAPAHAGCASERTQRGSLASAVRLASERRRKVRDRADLA